MKNTIYLGVVMLAFAFVTGSSSPTYAQPQVIEEPVAKLPLRPREPSGSLNKYLGSLVTIEGVLHDRGGKVEPNSLVVETIDGRKVDRPFTILVKNVELPAKTRCVLKGYEVGEMIARPPAEYALMRELDIDTSELNRTDAIGWHWRPYFIPLMAVEPAGLKVSTRWALTERQNAAATRQSDAKANEPIRTKPDEIVPGVKIKKDRPDYVMTRHLFEEYVWSHGRVGRETIQAATHLVAERGRENGFWKEVLVELQRSQPEGEKGCLRVLGKMLAVDAGNLDYMRRPRETRRSTSYSPHVYLGPEVVSELLALAAKTDLDQVDHYMIALARARAPETRDFFKSILAAERVKRPQVVGELPDAGIYLASPKFHAAVGLAQLGDKAGLDWLIANSEYNSDTVRIACPVGIPNGSYLGQCCQEALRILSGDSKLDGKVAWDTWAKTVDSKTLRTRVVRLHDPY